MISDGWCKENVFRVPSPMPRVRGFKMLEIRVSFGSGRFKL